MNEITITSDDSNVDWSRVQELFCSVGWEERSISDIRHAFERSTHQRFAFFAGKLVGFARTVDDGLNYALICDLVVDPRFQNRGIGGQLLGELKIACGSFRFVTLTAAEGKDGFYLKQGWLRQRTAFIAPCDEEQSRIHAICKQRSSLKNKDSSDVQLFDGKRIVFVASLNLQQQAQLFQMYQREWPSDTRRLRDMEHIVHGSDFLIGAIDGDSNELVGFCRVISDRGFRSWMFGMLVRHDVRGIGIGRALMDRLVRSVELAGVHSLSLTCAPDMVPFYEKWRFELREPQVVMDLQIRA